MKRILVVEDNPNLAAGLRMNLADAGFVAELAPSGERALAILRGGGIHLVVLDLMLPGIDGLGVLHALRGAGHQMPVLVLTARGEESEKVQVLTAGADDYVTKPFGLRELMARVRALLRRAEPGAPPAPGCTITFGDVELRPGAHTATRAGRPLSFRPKEFELLVALVRRPGEILLRAELLHQVWGYQKEVSSRTLDTHVANLRRKVEPDPGAPRHIVTVHRLGYRFDP